MSEFKDLDDWLISTLLIALCGFLASVFHYLDIVILSDIFCILFLFFIGLTILILTENHSKKG
jgi:uncharacterized membrane protein